MAVVVTIAGTVCVIDEGTLAIALSLSGIDRLTVDVTSIDGSVRPALDDTIVVTFGGGTVFSGTIIGADEHGTQGVGLTPITTTVEAHGFKAYLKRRLVTATIPAGTLKAALLVLVAYLTPYGVTLDAAQVDGPTLPELIYDGKPLDEVVTDLRALTGYRDDMTHAKVWSMVAQGAAIAPFDIVDGDGSIDGDLTIRPMRTIYANRIIFKAGSGTAFKQLGWVGTDRVDDPGGEYSYFYVPYNVPADLNGTWPNVVSVTGQPNFSGPVLWGADTGHTWVWSWDYVHHRLQWDRTLAGDFDDAWVIPAVNYTAQYPFTVQAPDPATEPTAEQTAHGIYEAAVANPDVFDADVATAMAEAELAFRVASDARVAKYATYQDGLLPGQTQTIDSATRHVDASFLITDVRIADRRNLLRYEVAATEASAEIGSFRDTYSAWIATGSGASLAPSSANTGVSVSSSPAAYPLGGSRFHAVQVPA